MGRVVINEPFGNFLISPGATSIVGPFSTQGERKSLYSFSACCFSTGHHPLIGWSASPRNIITPIKLVTTIHKHSLENQTILLTSSDKEGWPDLIVTTRLVIAHSTNANVEVVVPEKLTPSDYIKFFNRIKETKMSVIARLPMLSSLDVASLASYCGINQFHICPDLQHPLTKNSVEINKRHTAALTDLVKSRLPGIKVCSTGWMTKIDDVSYYLNYGADQVGIKWLVTKPNLWFSGPRNKAVSTINSL